MKDRAKPYVTSSPKRLREIKKKIGYLPENNPLYTDMAIIDYQPPTPLTEKENERTVRPDRGRDRSKPHQTRGERRRREEAVGKLPLPLPSDVRSTVSRREEGRSGRALTDRCERRKSGSPAFSSKRTIDDHRTVRDFLMKKLTLDGVEPKIRV